MTREDFERLKALFFGEGNIEFNEEEQKCYLKILRHNYCVFMKELEKFVKED